MTRSPMTTPDHTRLSKTSTEHTRPDRSAIFPQAVGGLTSAETRARISEISTFLVVMARWLRESRQREIATHRDWAYSGGW